MIRDAAPTWPGANIRSIVSEMLNDSESLHWTECRKFVEGYLRYSGVPPDHLDDIVQNVMLTVTQGLCDFRGQGLRTWLRRIADSRKIDWFRQMKRDKPGENVDPQLRKASEPTERHADAAIAPESSPAIEAVPAPYTVEEEVLGREEMRETMAAFADFVKNHEHQERFRKILQMFCDGYSQKEIAKEIGLSAARVSQIVNAAEQSVRKRTGRER